MGIWWPAADSAKLRTAAQACNAMAKALDEYAQAVDDARVKVEELVAEIGTAVVLGVVLGVCTVGIATAAAGAVSVSLVASAEVVGITLTQTAGLIIGGMVVGARFRAVEAMAIDNVALQPEEMLLLHDQKDFNRK